MDRIINVKINGNFLTKDSRRAGAQYEGNVTKLRIEFDSGWDLYAKKVTFWNALGEEPVERTLTTNMWEDGATSTRIYICPIPQEATTEAGELTFVVDGYYVLRDEHGNILYNDDGTPQFSARQRSVSDTLEVLPAPYIESTAEPTDPTPTQAEQLQAEIDSIQDKIKNVEIANETADEVFSAAETAVAAQGAAEQSATEAKQGATDAKNYADNVKEIALGDVSGLFVAKTGDTMTGNLEIEREETPEVVLTANAKGAAGRVQEGNHSLLLIAANTPDSLQNYRAVIVRDSTSRSDIKDAVQLIDNVNNTAATYNLYHTANKPSPLDVEAFTYGTQRTAIPANADLNNYTAIGCYKCSANTNAATVTNSPIAQAFILDVISNTGAHTDVTAGTYNNVVQRLTAYSGEVYWRKINGNGTTINYGTWRKVYDSGNFNLDTMDIAYLGTNRDDITAGDDLNSYVTVGSYRSQTAEITESLANCPTVKQFVMDVISSTGAQKNVVAGSHGYVVQRITDTNGCEWRRYITCNATATINYGPWISGNFVSGSYIGTGTYGADNPITIVFPFCPQVVILHTGATVASGADPGKYLVAVNPRTKSILGDLSYTTISWGDFAMSLYSDMNPDTQFNYLGNEYFYKAWG